MTKLIVIGLLGLAACGHHPNHYDVKLQDGTPGYRLDCDVTQYSNKECLDEAVSLCAGGGVEVSGGSNNGSYTIVRCLKK